MSDGSAEPGPEASDWYSFAIRHSGSRPRADDESPRRTFRVSHSAHTSDASTPIIGNATRQLAALRSTPRPVGARRHSSYHPTRAHCPAGWRRQAPLRRPARSVEFVRQTSDGALAPPRRASRPYAVGPVCPGGGCGDRLRSGAQRCLRGGVGSRATWSSEIRRGPRPAPVLGSTGNFQAHEAA